MGNINALPLTATNSSYSSDYYLQVNVSGFSSFYFANKTLPAILPVNISAFMGEHNGTVNILNWKFVCNGAVTFIIERSEDGIHFINVGTLIATAAHCDRPFVFKDQAPSPGKNYYRLKVIETGGSVNYSTVILLQGDNNGPLLLTINPNVVQNEAITVQINSYNKEQVHIIITDVQGRRILQKEVTVQAGNSTTSITTKGLASGVYWLYGNGSEGRSNVVKFIKN
jgi:hypothetical protein